MLTENGREWQGKSQGETGSGMKQIIFRDDDVGYIKPCFETFLKIFIEESIPVSLAVIPSRLTPETYSVIEKYLGTGLIEIVQHGFAHHQHGVRAEFPDSRSKDIVRKELEEGKRIPEEKFGRYFYPVLAPGWHQIAKGHYENTKNIFRGISAAREKRNRDIKIDYLVNIWASKGSPVCFAKAEKMIEELSEDLNIILLHHGLYEESENEMEELKVVIKYAKKDNIPIVKFSDLN